MQYIKANTSMPVPTILNWGMKGPYDIGPYILMEFINYASNLTAQLRAPSYTRDDRPFLDHDIEETKLEHLYGQVADILLQLSRHSFDKIGSIIDHSDHWSVDKRPLTMNMNELVQLLFNKTSLFTFCLYISLFLKPRRDSFYASINTTQRRYRVQGGLSP